MNGREQFKQARAVVTWANRHPAKNESTSLWRERDRSSRVRVVLSLMGVERDENGCFNEEQERAVKDILEAKDPLAERAAHWADLESDPDFTSWVTSMKKIALKMNYSRVHPEPYSG